MKQPIDYESFFIELGANLKSDKPVRNIVISYEESRIEQFRKKHNNTDVFKSAFCYDNQEIRTGKQIAPLYFDFDGEYAKDDLQALIELFLKNECPNESLNIYYSGNKGFHLEVSFEALDIEADTQLNKIFEVIAKDIKVTIHTSSLDTGIYDAVRLWRLPNSINSGSGLYKIPLTLEELNLSIEEIRNLAKEPRYDFKQPQPVVWSNFAQVFKRAKKRLSNSNLKGGVFEPVGEGQRNEATFKRAIRLRGEGKSFDEAVEICSKIQDTPTKLSANEIRRTVASAYQEKYIVEPVKNKKTRDQDEAETTSFIVTNEGAICEEVFDPAIGEPQFAVYKDQSVEYCLSVEKNGRLIRPINDNIVREGVIKFPTQAIEYGTENELLNKIKEFIHDYVDMSEEWEQWAVYYVPLSWVYDKLPVCPYLFALGPSSSGKTRLIQAVGAICYKPFIASGSITASPIFRVLDRFRGTLIVNEFDHIGEFNSEIITIFNNGYEANFPVIRTEGDEKKEVRIFQVYGPKLFSARKRKSDWAFESRLLTVPMKETSRKDIPPFLLEDFHKRAQELRDMLLMFRFRHYHKVSRVRTDLFPNIRGRLRQTLLSIASVIQDESFLEKAQEFAKQLENNLKTIKEFDLDFFTYQVLMDCWAEGNKMPQIKEVAGKVRELADFDKLSSKAIGNIVRDELGFETKRGGTSGNYVILLSSGQLDNLKERYEINISLGDETLQTSASSESSVPATHDSEVTEHTELRKEPINEPLPY